MFLEQLCTIVVLLLWLKSTNRSSIDIEDIRTGFILYIYFFMKDILNVKNTNKSNIQPNISISKKNN